MSRYYQLDKQGFGAISCDIDVPFADKFLQQIRTAMIPLGDKVKVTDTLATYHLTYSKLDGLHITDPGVDVVVKPGFKPADPARLEEGRQRIVSGFNTMAAGSDAEITAAFKLFESPKSDDYEILYVHETPDGYSVSYRDKKSGAQMTDQLVGRQLDGKASQTTTNMSYRVEFSSMSDGKLLMKDMTMDEDQAQMMRSHAIITMDYQLLGAVTFPKHIGTKTSIDAMQATHQDVDIGIDFQNCKIQ